MGNYSGEEFVSFDKSEIIKRSKELFDLVQKRIKSNKYGCKSLREKYNFITDLRLL